jgi:hypothetical protein
MVVTSPLSTTAETSARPRGRPVSSLFSAHFSGSSDSTASDIPGPGRLLGHVFSVSGRYVEAAAAHAAAISGLGLPGAAAHVLAHLRGRHAACQAWPPLVSCVVDMAVEVGNGYCLRCRERYYSPSASAADEKLVALLTRVFPALQLVISLDASLGVLIFDSVTLSATIV